jgi:hypothetical protein
MEQPRTQTSSRQSAFLLSFFLTFQFLIMVNPAFNNADNGFGNGVIHSRDYDRRIRHVP